MTSVPDEKTSRAPTIYDVAVVAGVSHQTVSRYLKGYQGIRPATKKLVVDAIAELGYRPNQTARLLAHSQPHRIGVLTDATTQIGPSRIAQGIGSAARQAGYLLDVITLDPTDELAIRDALESLDRPDVAGVLALVSTDQMMQVLDASGTSVSALVSIERDDEDGSTGAPSVGWQAVHLLVDHLVGLGHREVVHVAGPSSWPVARNRDAAYRHALRASGLSARDTLHGDWSARSGYAAVADGLPEGVTAVLCSNDQMAIGVLAALADQGVRVPEDVSVVGVDDIDEASFVRPALTTVRLDFEAQGRATLEQLLEQVAGRPAGADTPGAEASGTVDLVLRASSGAAPPTA